MGEFNDKDRKAFAEQLLANPLFDDILATIERDHMEALVMADTEQKRIDAQTRVKAARAFRDELTMMVNTRERRGAPA